MDYTEYIRKWKTADPDYWWTHGDVHQPSMESCAICVINPTEMFSISEKCDPSYGDPCPFQKKALYLLFGPEGAEKDFWAAYKKPPREDGAEPEPEPEPEDTAAAEEAEEAAELAAELKKKVSAYADLG